MFKIYVLYFLKNFNKLLFDFYTINRLCGEIKYFKKEYK